MQRDKLDGTYLATVAAGWGQRSEDTMKECDGMNMMTYLPTWSTNPTGSFTDHADQCFIHVATLNVRHCRITIISCVLFQHP